MYDNENENKSYENAGCENAGYENTGYENVSYENTGYENTGYENKSYDNTDNTGTTGGYTYYNYYNHDTFTQNDTSNERFDEYGYAVNSKPGKKKKQKKGKSALQKIGFAAAIAAVCGVVGGGTFYAANYIGNRFIYDTTKTSALPGTAVTPTLPDSSFEESVQEVMENSSSSTESSMSYETAAAGDYGTVAEVAEECMPSLVTIATISVQEMQSIFGGRQQYEAHGAGTGVIVGQNETELLIATNNHVINGATSVSVGFIDETSVSANVKGIDADNDLAVVAIKLSDIPQETLNQIKIATIGDSDELVLGEQVVAIGNALGYGQSVTSGYVSAFDRDLTLSDGSSVFTSTGLIMFDAAINAGNSGGALFNMKGELVGINEAKSSSTSFSEASIEGMSYAIPVAKALPILQELMSLPTRDIVDAENMGYLGVTCADVTEDIAASYNMPEGVCLTEVLAGSPAEAAGLLKGDVLVEIEGRKVKTYEALCNELQYCAIGQTVELKVMRANNGEYQELTVNVTLGDRSVIEEYYNSVQQGND